jgi:hypothetical protein
MVSRKILRRFGLTSPWSVELGIAVLGLLMGALLMPILIFYAGTLTLGRYEGAGIAPLFRSLWIGLGQGSVASWIVLFGPYGFYLLFRALRAWWRASAPST